MKAKSYSALQKSYDQAYLTCSTAIYYESLNNEAEALRSWRECLGQLQGFSCPAYSKQRTDAEAKLLQSLKAMKEQCEDRVGLLQILIASKTEGTPSINVPPCPLTPPVLPEHSPPIGDTQRSQLLYNTSKFSIRSTATNSNTIGPKLPNCPTADKKGFLTTLRTDKKTRRESIDTWRKSTSQPVQATRAATLAWNSITRKEGESVAHSFTVPSSMDTLNMRSDVITWSTTGSIMRLKNSQMLGFGNKQAAEGTEHDCKIVIERKLDELPGVRCRPSQGRVRERPRSSVFPLGDTEGGNLQPPLLPPHQVPVRHLPPIPRKPLPRHNSSGKDCASDESNQPLLLLKVPPRLSEKQDRLRFTLTEGSEGGFRGRGRSGPEPQAPFCNIESNSLQNSTRRKSSLIEISLATNELEDLSDGARPSDVNLSGDNWDDRLLAAMKSVDKGVDGEALKQVANEIVVKGDDVRWSDVAGLEGAKQALKEAVVYPFLRPDLFSGLREPARGMLLFGPPGTGKTMLARAVATESRSTFFSISASSLTSKYLGESEKLVRALFALAKALAPSIIFVDEIDSLLSSRSGSGENEATRRIKTEFLIQWSDLARAAAGKESSSSSGGSDVGRVLVLAATNLPWAIDEAARRRFVRRQYIPLPEIETRKKHLQTLLGRQKNSLSDLNMKRLVNLTNGFSGSDITALAKDAAMGPLRSLGERDLLYMKMEDIRPIEMKDFEKSLEKIRPSVSVEGLQKFEEWADKFGERA